MKYINWTVIIGMLLGFLIGFLSTRACHGATMTTRCVVGNRDCFVLRAGSGKLSPVQRMALVNDRLAAVLGVAKPEDIHAVFTSRLHSDVAILCGNWLIVTVTGADARSVGAANQETLAKVWARNLILALQNEDVTPTADQNDGPVASRGR